MKKNEQSGERLSWVERIGYASGDMACNFIYQIVCMFLTIYYTDVFGIAPAVVSVLFLASRIWDAVNDPIMGAIVDKTNTKRGKFRPWLLWGAIPFAVSGILCFTLPNGLSSTGRIVWACVTYVVLTMVYTMINTPYGALTSALTQDPQERAKLTVIRMIGATTGMLFVSVGVPYAISLYPGNEGQGYHNIMIIYSIIGALLLLFCYKSTKERYSVPGESRVTMKSMVEAIIKNKPLLILCLMMFFNYGINTIVTSSASYYFTYYLGNTKALGTFNMIGTLTALVVMLFVPKVLDKVDKKWLYLIGSVGMAVQPIYMYICPQGNTDLTGLYVARFIWGLFYGFNISLIWSFVPDTVEYGEYVNNNRMEGITYAATGFFFKCGMALAGIIPGIVLQVTNYVPNSVQTDEALMGIKMLNTTLPIVLTIILSICVILYPLTQKENYRILEELRKRKENDANVI